MGYLGPDHVDNYESPGTYEFDSKGSNIYGKSLSNKPGIKGGAGKPNTGDGGVNYIRTPYGGGSGLCVMRNRRA